MSSSSSLKLKEAWQEPAEGELFSFEALSSSRNRKHTCCLKPADALYRTWLPASHSCGKTNQSPLAKTKNSALCPKKPSTQKKNGVWELLNEETCQEHIDASLTFLPFLCMCLLKFSFYSLQLWPACMLAQLNVFYHLEFILNLFLYLSSLNF